MSIQGSQRFMGEAASSIARSNYKNTITCMRRLLGCRFDVPETQVEIARSSAIAIGVILVELHRTCVDADDLSDLMKAKICAKIAAADKALIDGADEHLQVYERGVGV